MWGYDKMKPDDQVSFDKYIKDWTDFHQENDAKIKESTGYYKMTQPEKDIFDKMHVKMNENRDYYGAKFDAEVKKEMMGDKFKAMSADGKLKYLNDLRSKNDDTMKRFIMSDNIDELAKKAMEKYNIPATA